MSRLHRALLRLLPSRRRERHGAEIERVFAEQRAVARPRERLRLWVKEIAAVARVAVIERVPGRRTPLPGECRPPRIGSGWTADLTQSLRRLGRSPWYAATVIVCLGTGLAATTSALSMVNTLLFGALPGIEARETLSRVYLRGQYPPNLASRSRTMNISSLGSARFDELRTHGPAVAALAGQRMHTFVVRVGGDTVNLPGSFVSGDYFRALGTQPVAGRLLAAADEDANAPVLVVSDRFRQTYFGARDALGAVITVGGHDMQIVGVAPARFAGYRLSGLADGWVAPQIWLPLSYARGWPGLRDSEQAIDVAVRHAPGATRDAVATALAASVARMDPAPGRELSLNLKPLGHLPQTSGRELASLVAAFLVGPLVLLVIGCANVANLQLARALERTRELAVRLSLGASRGRVVRLLAIETAVVTAVALAIAWFGATTMLGSLSSILPVPAVPDWRVALLSAAVAAAVTMVAGVAPGWIVASRVHLAGLKETRQVGARFHTRLRHALVVVQVALSLALLVASALLTRVLRDATADVPAVASELLVANLNFQQSGLAESAPAEVAADLLSRFERDSRVRAAAISTATDLFLRQEVRYLRPGDDPRAVRQFANVQDVSPGFFQAFGLTPLTGRTLTATDRGTTAAVINVVLEEKLRADGGAVVGRRLVLNRYQGGTEESVPVEIVGVVPTEFKRWERPAHTPQIYLPLGDRIPVTFTFYLRADDPLAWAMPIRRAVAARDGRGVIVDVATAADRVRQEFGPVRALGIAVAWLGGVALLLAAAGLYAVVAYVVSLRTREIGVRMAVGATQASVVRLVLRQALRLVTIGAGIGVALTIPIALALRGMFVGVSAVDPLTIGPALAALGLATVLASVVPARRAARIDPVTTLKAD